MHLLWLNEPTAALRRVPVVFVDDIDGKTPETGITLTAGDAKVRKGGSTTEANHAGTLFEISGGDYFYEFSVGELDTVGALFARFIKAGVRTFRIDAQVVAFNPNSAINLGLSGMLSLINAGIRDQGVPQAVGASSITLRAASVIAHQGNRVYARSTGAAAGTGQSRVIKAYNSGTQQADITPPWSPALTLPVEYDLYVGEPAPADADAQNVNLTATAVDGIFTEAVPGSYGAGTAGLAIGGIAAITTKTANLPTDPADASDIAALFDAVTSATNAIQAKTDLIPGTQDGRTYAATFLLMAATLLGKSSGLGTANAVYRAINDSKNRVTATVDEDGNRSAVTLDAT